MRTELDLWGVYVPGLLCAAVLAFALNTVSRRLLGWIGFYRWVWHRPLFDMALYVAMLGVVVWGGGAAGWL